MGPSEIKCQDPIDEDPDVVITSECQRVTLGRVIREPVLDPAGKAEIVSRAVLVIGWVGDPSAVIDFLGNRCIAVLGNGGDGTGGVVDREEERISVMNCSLVVREVATRGGAVLGRARGKTEAICGNGACSAAGGIIRARIVRKLLPRRSVGAVAVYVITGSPTLPKDHLPGDGVTKEIRDSGEREIVPLVEAGLAGNTGRGCAVGREHGDAFGIELSQQQPRGHVAATDLEILAPPIVVIDEVPVNDGHPHNAATIEFLAGLDIRASVATFHFAGSAATVTAHRVTVVAFFGSDD